MILRMVETLFQDIFRVKGLDPDGKKFDKGEDSVNYLLLFLEIC